MCVQYTCAHRLHGRIRPNDRLQTRRCGMIPKIVAHLIQSKSMRADDFIDVLVPSQIANLNERGNSQRMTSTYLRTRVDLLHLHVGGGVPEANAAIRAAPARCQESALVMRPGDRLHSCPVLRCNALERNNRGRSLNFATGDVMPGVHISTFSPNRLGSA